MTGRPIIFLNARQAESGMIDDHALPRDYVHASRFLGCSIIDRTGTLDLGFPNAVLDPIPAPARGGPTFAELCDSRGAEIGAEAASAGKEIVVLWSGGIDSTTALIAIIKAAESSGCTDRVRVLMSLDSVHEYPGFFLRFIDGRYRIQRAVHPIAAALDPNAINVTGEHGDQLFGSHLLESYVRRGVGHVPYREILPVVLLERLRNPLHARRVRRYLEPVIAAAPVTVQTLFDCMWWFNFALKWQEVTLRLTVLHGDQAGPVYRSFRHFFRDDRFQAWALARSYERTPSDWMAYKQTAKQYILAFTGDLGYYNTKVKEDSLRNVMIGPGAGLTFRVFMRDDFRPVVKPVAIDEPFGRWRRLFG